MWSLTSLTYILILFLKLLITSNLGKGQLKSGKDMKCAKNGMLTITYTNYWDAAIPAISNGLMLIFIQKPY